MKNLSLRQLQVFATLADLRSHAAAAEACGITQPAVSMLMKQLEGEVGLPLWQGRGKQQALTPAGDAVLRHARAIQDQLRRLEERLEQVQSGALGQLHLGVVPTANYWAPQLLMGFERTHPGCTFKLSVGPRAQVLSWLKHHQIDLAIGGHPPAEADVDVQAFARHPHCIVARADHPLAGQRQVPWSALRSEPFIFREAGSATRSFLEHLLQGQSLQVTARAELAGNETVKQAVMAGMGISFMSAHAIQVELQAQRLAILDVVGMPKWLDWCLISRREEPESELAAAFRTYVLAEGARHAVTLNEPGPATGKRPRTRARAA